MSLIRLDVLAHADFHGQFREDEENPGLSRFFCCADSFRKTNPEYTLLLDAGDESKCLWHGKDVYEGLSLLQTDAMVLGNHEFDRGETDLLECISYANDHFPVLCANIINRESGKPIKGTLPYILLHKRDVTIGILGLSSSYTPYIVEKSAFEPFEMLDSVKVIKQYVPEMKAQGADIIILLSHFPFYPDESGELFEVFDQVKDLPIDVFIGGHIPGDYAKAVGSTAIVKGGFHGVSLPHVALFYDTDLHCVVERRTEVLDVLNGLTQKDEKVDAFVARVTAPYRAYYEEEITIAKEVIPMYLNKESPLGDLISDAVRDAVNTDVVYLNCTSCGRGLEKGIITPYKISKAIYFNEHIQLTQMSGKDLRMLFELVHEPEIFGNNAEVMFSGLRVVIDHNQPAGKKVISIQRDGVEIDENCIYSVATSKYMSSGGNGTSSFAERFRFHELSITTHQAIIQYLRKKERIKAEIDQRYVFIGTPENDHAPW